MPNIQAERITVAVKSGAVTLTGQVETYPEKHHAVRSAFRVRGVTAVVADEIEVHNAWLQREDAEIAREAGKALRRTRVATVGSVQTTVHDHVVTLTGTVGWHYEREAIGHPMSLLPGVHGVSNRISLRPVVRVSPSVAMSEIAEAFHRHATIEAERITVSVLEDTVTLTGNVATWEERNEAGQAAWATPGVTAVQNDLHIRR